MFQYQAKQNKFALALVVIVVALASLACGSEGLITVENAQAGLAVMQTAAHDAQAYATQAAPTMQVLATQVSAYATQAAPTLEAAAAHIKETSADAQATLQAAGVDRDYLLAKARSLKPDENGDVHLTITEVELNLVLQARLLFAEQNGEDVALQGTSARLTNGTIILNGRVERPVAGDLTIVLQPFVINNDLKMNVVSATLSDYPVPDFLLSQADDTLDETLNSAADQTADSVIVKSVAVGEGYMTIVVGKDTA